MKQCFRIIGLGVIMSCTSALKAADSLTVQQKLMHVDKLCCKFREQVWLNLAMRYGQLPFSLTSVQLNGRSEQRGEAAVKQEGNGEKAFGFEVNSFVVLSQASRLFGSASYRHGKHEEVRWNENADFNLLFPYVTGDSIGGFMKEEAYRFSGGYAHTSGSWRWGAELAYRAMLAYRDKDPRPRNVVSDLRLTLSAARQIGAAYHLGTSLSVRTYDQQSGITFNGDKGSTSVYQMLGLGMDYVRFAGNQFYAHYEGFGLGGSLDLLPIVSSQTHTGFTGSLRGDYLHLTKKLDGISEPLTALNHYELALETSWMKETHRWIHGVQLTSKVHQRVGRETVFGEPTNGVYTKLHDVEQLTCSVLESDLSGVWQKKLTDDSAWGWQVRPTVGYRLFKSTYRAAHRSLEISSASGGLQLQSTRRVGRVLLTGGLDGGYVWNLTAKQELPGLKENSSVGQTLLANTRYLSDNHVATNLLLRGHYAWSSAYALQLTGRWLHENYKKSGRINLFELSLGVLF